MLGLGLGLNKTTNIVSGGGGGGSYNQYTQDLIDYADANTISKPSTAYLNALDTLLSGWDSDGILAVTDVLNIYATEGSKTDWVKLNVVNPGTYDMTFNGTLTQIAKQGVQGDGSTGYAISAFNPTSSPSPNYTQNNASHGVYVYTKGSNTRNYTSFDGGATLSRLFINSTMRCSLNEDTRTAKAFTNTVIMSRSVSGTKRISADGAAPTSHADVTTGLPNGSLVDFCFFGSGSPVSLTDGTISCRIVGGNLTDSQMQSFHTRLATYLTTISSL